MHKKSVTDYFFIILLTQQIAKGKRGNLTCLSLSPFFVFSFLLFFLWGVVIATLGLKLFNIISVNLVVIQYIPCRFTQLTKILIQVFFIGAISLFNLEVCPKFNVILKQFVIATPPKPINRMSCNFVAYLRRHDNSFFIEI